MQLSLGNQQQKQNWLEVVYYENGLGRLLTQFKGTDSSSDSRGEGEREAAGVAVDGEIAGAPAQPGDSCAQKSKGNFVELNSGYFS